MSQNPYILRATEFEVNPSGHGGNRRTAQIDELVREAGLGISNLNIDIKTTTRWSRYLKGIQVLAKQKFKIKPDYRIISGCGFEYQIYQEALNKHSGQKILLWEATKNYIGCNLASQAKFKIICIPQNLESLVVGNLDRFTGESLPNSLENEIQYISKSDAVFCISREEQWLLNLRGINADYLPYYPPKEIVDNLLKIRELRTKKTPERFLMLGSATNTPTKLGIIEVLNWLKHVNFNNIIDIAGYGTEFLQEYCDGEPNFNLHGTVNQEKLTELLINAKAVLSHQRATSGALTRIPEMLIAGIPVIANNIACRSAFSYPGVYCYDNESELADLMSKQIESPSVLRRPIEAEKRFIDCLKQLSQ